MIGWRWLFLFVGGGYCLHLFKGTRDYGDRFLGEYQTYSARDRSYLFSYKHGRTSIISEAIDEDLQEGEGESRTQTQRPFDGPINPLIIAAEARESEYCYGRGLSILRDRYGQYKPAYKTSSVFGGRTCSEKEFRGFKQIGRGAYGRVWRAEHRETGIKVAIKELMRSNDLRLIRREECIQHSLSSDFVARHFCTISERGGIAFVMELIDGHTLYEARESGQLPVQDIAAQLILTLEYLHTKHILYRDLKPENVMYIPETGQTKLIDFGLSVELYGPYWQTKGIAGTPEFMAPEVVQRGSYYSFPADWYSMGLVIYELIAGKNPFDGIKPVEVQYQRIQQGFACRLQDRSACDLIRAMTHPDPEKRWGHPKGTLRLIKRHPWFIGVRWRNYDRRIRTEKPSSRTVEASNTLEEGTASGNPSGDSGPFQSNTHSNESQQLDLGPSRGGTTVTTGSTNTFGSLRRTRGQPDGKPKPRRKEERKITVKARLQPHIRGLQIVESEDESSLSSISSTELARSLDVNYVYDPIFRADPQYVLFQPEFTFPTHPAAVVHIPTAAPNEDYISDHIAEGKAPVFSPAWPVNPLKRQQKKTAKR